MKKTDAIFALNEAMLKDFEEFKKRNELVYCGCKQTHSEVDYVEVTWTTTKRYSEFDIEKITNDFESFLQDNPGHAGSITKITCQDSMYIVEYSVFSTYEVDLFKN